VSGKTINLTLNVWRQDGSAAPGRLETYAAENIPTDASFLEMLDIVNERLTLEGRRPIAFDHDCREGICGMCGAVVNGRPHGPERETTLCQLHMRHFLDGDTIVIEPFRSRAFPLIKDLAVDRRALDHIIIAGGYVSVNTGQAVEANTLPVPKDDADLSMDAAACIGCGACVAACPNAAAMLFVSAKVSHLGLLPQGRPEAARRALSMVAQMDAQGFGNCTNHRECEMECPKGISISHIARLNREFLKAALWSREKIPAGTL
jgi:succinate dehydrogenase / fumarate reductase iron-sulfur subunit